MVPDGVGTKLKITLSHINFQYFYTKYECPTKLGKVYKIFNVF
jgi:hypothetical protein